MENIIVFSIILVAIIQFIMIVTFFVMSNNVSAMRSKIAPSGEDFKAKFYSLISLGDKVKAKALLYDRITKEQDFINAACHREKFYIDTAQESLSKEYSPELKALGMESFDFSALEEN